MPNFDVYIDEGRRYVFSVQAATKEEAAELAVNTFKFEMTIEEDEDED